MMSPVSSTTAARCGRLCGVVLLILLAATSGQAQAPDAPKPAEPEPLTESLIQQRRKQAEEAKLEESVQTRVNDLYQRAQEAFASAKTFQALAESHKAAILTTPDELRAVRRSLQSFDSTPTEPISGWTELSVLQQELAEHEQQLEAERKQLAELEEKLKNRLTRKPEEKQEAVRQQLAEAEQQLAQRPFSDSSPVALAERTSLRAKILSLTAELEAYRQEEARNKAEAELLPLQRDLAVLRIARLQQTQRMYQAEISRRRRLDQKTQREEALGVIAEVERDKQPPLLLELARQNLATVETRAKVLAQTVQVNSDLQQTRARLDAITQQFQQSRERVKAAGPTSAIGLLLLKQKSNLPNLARRRTNVRNRQALLQDVQLAMFELEDRRAALANLEQARFRLMGLVAPPGIDEAERQELSALADDLLETDKRYLDSLIRDYNELADKLIDLDTIERKLIAETVDFSGFIRERVLWIRSTTRLDSQTLAGSRTAVIWLTDPASWRDVFRQLGRDAWINPVLWGLGLCVLIPLLYQQPRMRMRITEIGARAERSTACETSPTLQAMLLTLLISLPWPGILWFLGWRLGTPTEGTEFTRAIAAGLTRIAMIFLPFELFRQICRAHGLAESHFLWPTSGLLVLRRQLRLIRYTILPTSFLAAVMEQQSGQAMQDSLGRLAFIVTMLLTALFMQRVLRPVGGALQETLAREQKSWLGRLQNLVYAVAVLCPMALAALSVAGYHYTAGQLVVRLYATLWLVLTLIIISAIVLRWALVTRRRLAIEKARQRREQATESHPGPESANDMNVEQPGLDVTAMNTQARQLLRSVMVIGGVVGLYFIWVDVLPALGVLRGYILTTVDGVAITLADLMLSLLLVVLTIVGSRNIPGLLEMAVLQRVPLENSSRYAIVTLARYAIIIVGIVSAFHVVGVGWDKVQWLVAALSLGLGFGMQEIFANFVSGVIILFECPVRVGDIVTIDGVTGVVSRIRIRATTITNWDRQELVIPNKEFITGRVLNWTLTDQVNRVFLVVGIAYGSDTRRASELLLKVAQEHPVVLTEPVPVVTFAGFGDSTLNMELRCYLPSLDQRLAVIHELHTAIDDEFRAAGIEIAFPQRDLHIRSIAASIPVPTVDGGMGGNPQPHPQHQPSSN